MADTTVTSSLSTQASVDQEEERMQRFLDQAGADASFDKYQAWVDSGEKPLASGEKPLQTPAKLTERYLPKQIDGASVLKHVGDDVYRAEGGVLKAETASLAYRIGKTMTNKDVSSNGLKWGNTIRGHDEGDGWVKVSVTPELSPLSNDMLSTMSEEDRMNFFWVFNRDKTFDDFVEWNKQQQAVAQSIASKAKGTTSPTDSTATPTVDDSRRPTKTEDDSRQPTKTEQPRMIAIVPEEEQSTIRGQQNNVATVVSENDQIVVANEPEVDGNNSCLANFTACSMCQSI